MPKDLENNSYNKNTRKMCFEDYYKECFKELWAITELEHKYPFFRISNPSIVYNVGKSFDMNVRYNLELKAKKSDKYIQVTFNGGHNYLDVSLDSSGKSVRMEAQEKMYCDEFEGYKHIRKYFEEHGEIRSNNYYIELNNDLLHFDDRDEKHLSFRGWTGGYDPTYGSGSSGIYSGHILMKKEWDSEEFTKPLEKRINTLKMLFDGINNYAKFDIEENNKSPLNVPNYKNIYSELKNSEYYHHITKFSEIVSQRLNIEHHYDMIISMDGANKPRIRFKHSNDVEFFIDFLEYNGKIGSCEIHVPMMLADNKKFNQKEFLIYNKTDSMMPGIEKDILTNSHRDKMIGKVIYFEKEKDIPKTLETCLNSIKKKKLIEIIPGLKNMF